MQGVPEQFTDERDSARFRHLAQLPGTGFITPISLTTPSSRTLMKPSATIETVPNATALAVVTMNRTRSTPGIRH